MRLAVIADIHGNADALEAVLADIAALGIAEIVNLGDHLSGPLAAARTADILMPLGLTSIRGNHDRLLIEQDRADMGASDAAAFDQLEAHHLDWLRAQPATLLHRGEIFMCHGTPGHDETYLLEEVTAEGAVHPAARARVEALAAGCDHPVILCGHSHTPRIVQLADGRLVVNPGSVGVPGYIDTTPVRHVMQTGSPLAAYAILNRTAEGAYEATHRHVAYDTRAMAGMARDAGRSEWASAIATGWVEEI